MDIFLVLELRLLEDGKTKYLVVGIFSTEDKAKENCISPNHQYGKFELDAAMHEDSPWPTEKSHPVEVFWDEDRLVYKLEQ